MPSKDGFHAKKPSLNETLGLDGRARPKKAGRSMSGQIQRLARRLEKDPDEIARKIPEDTLRRTKYPVIEEVTEDGKRIFKHDPGIIEAPRSVLHK